MNSTDEILEWLKRPVDIQNLIDKLAFDLDNFEQANLEHPKLRLEAGRYLTWAVLEKGKAEARLEFEQAEAGIEIRGKGKVTDKAATEQVIADDKVRERKKKLYMAKAAEVWAKQLVEVYDQRKDIMSNITKIRAGEMATELRQVKEKAAVDVIRKSADRMRRDDR